MEKRMRQGQKKYLKNNGWKLPKYDEKYQPSRSLANPKQGEYKENHIYAYHSETDRNWRWKNTESNQKREKKRYIINKKNEDKNNYQFLTGGQKTVEWHL